METNRQVKTLIRDADVPWTDLGSGVRRKVMAFNEAMMIVKVAFEAGAVGTLHHHPHIQASYIAEGRFEIEIDGRKKTLSAGDVYFVPEGLVHGALCLEEGMLIDVFHPLREDFL